LSRETSCLSIVTRQCNTHVHLDKRYPRFIRVRRSRLPLMPFLASESNRLPQSYRKLYIVLHRHRNSTCSGINYSVVDRKLRIYLSSYRFLSSAVFRIFVVLDRPCNEHHTIINSRPPFPTRLQKAPAVQGLLFTEFSLVIAVFAWCVLVLRCMTFSTGLWQAFRNVSGKFVTFKPPSVFPSLSSRTPGQLFLSQTPLRGSNDGYRKCRFE
jgi:hypothetical protein